MEADEVATADHGRRFWHNEASVQMGTCKSGTDGDRSSDSNADQDSGRATLMVVSWVLSNIDAFYGKAIDEGTVLPTHKLQQVRRLLIV